jgi:prepilin-type processing-associated H-X9-DG protein
MGYFELVNCRSVYQVGTGTGIGDHRRPLDPNRKQRVGSFHSSHPGGANFLLGDGSVTFVNQSIDIAILRSLSSISGAEPANYE